MMHVHLVEKTVDRDECGRGNVIERSPVLRDEIARSQLRKESEGAGAGDMSLSTPRFPCRRVANGKQCEIELPPASSHVPVHECGRVRCKRSVAREKAAEHISI